VPNPDDQVADDHALSAAIAAKRASIASSLEASPATRAGPSNSNASSISELSLPSSDDHATRKSMDEATPTSSIQGQTCTSTMAASTPLEIDLDSLDLVALSQLRLYLCRVGDVLHKALNTTHTHPRLSDLSSSSALTASTSTPAELVTNWVPQQGDSIAI